ncbi:serpin family protein [Cyclobacterium sp. 1_MG-2023]|uniref:serpin family protein n=1 Tax=Cyclobacterium sp. 1_MG-2023 TaxID=3062681 RepID=UPI0026E1EF21|nr:serpin family protein [Cyclobacterium sp. 1_MG-2023]MDO6437490.1 serpin family protein [Cyclobacterium sp. 1_MG-2023]
MKITTALLCLMVFTACNWGEDEEIDLTANIRPLQVQEQEMVSSSSQFAFDLFHELQKKEDVNQFFSPYSVHQALAMAMNGNEDEVEAEFMQVLRFEGMELEEANKAAKSLTDYLLALDPKVRLSIANAIWYKQGFELNQEFAEDVRDSFSAEIASLDMSNPQSKEVINQWIENNTNGMIKDMLDYVDPAAVMYLVNAIYFKANWKYRFDVGNTKKAPFYTASGQEVDVDMMQMSSPAGLRYYADGALEYLEIPYSTGQYTMGVILDKDFELDSKMEAFTLEDLEHFRANADTSNFILKMPKFKMGYRIDNLKEELQHLGLVKPFVPSPLNFSKLFVNPTAPMAISRVIHEAVIEVSEEGTEAAAATIVAIETTSSGPSQPRVFSLDKPFVFFIQENSSGAILFVGKLGNPALLD